jgi:hypothetical protein
MLQYCPYRIAELQTVVDWLKTSLGESEPQYLNDDQGERVTRLMDLGNLEEIAKLPGQPSPSCSGRSDTPHHTTVAIYPNVAR